MPGLVEVPQHGGIKSIKGSKQGDLWLIIGGVMVYVGGTRQELWNRLRKRMGGTEDLRIHKVLLKSLS